MLGVFCALGSKGFNSWPMNFNAKAVNCDEPWADPLKSCALVKEFNVSNNKDL